MSIHPIFVRSRVPMDRLYRSLGLMTPKQEPSHQLKSPVGDRRSNREMALNLWCPSSGNLGSDLPFAAVQAKVRFPTLFSYRCGSAFRHTQFPLMVEALPEMAAYIAAQ